MKYDGPFGDNDEESKGKESSTAQQIKYARKISKLSKLSEVLRRNSSVGSGMDGAADREYRLLTAGEDGMVFWWSFKAPYIEDLSAIDKVNMENPQSLFLKVSPSKVQSLQSVHAIHLTETAQIYGLILGPTQMTIS